MNIDEQFIDLMEVCKQEIVNHLDKTSDTDRFNRMIKELNDLQHAVRSNMLVKDFYYLNLTQMVERDDPDNVIQKVLAVNDYYCKHYQVI